MIIAKSKRLFESAKKNIPGAVNSPVRAWQAVTGVPRFIARGEGAHVVDGDGNEYIDYVGSWGPLILGHAHPYVTGALRDALRQGTTFGAPTERELQLADIVCRLMPSIEKIRLVSSGTEATMSAIRLARAFTKRSKIVKFDGCYHGHSDGLLVKAAAPATTPRLPRRTGAV